MINSVSAYTFEIDRPEEALKEIRQQLNAGLVFRKNTAGILQCDPEFIQSGVVRMLCRSLDFPIVGGTTAAQAVNAGTGELCLSLLVMTSDDVEFVAGHTDGLCGGVYAPVQRAFAAASAKSALGLRLVLAFPPLMEEHIGDTYVDALEQVCGKTPVFGSLAIEDTIFDYDRSATICDGESFSRDMSFLLLFGEVCPRFLISTVPDSQMLPVHGEITRVDGNVLREINGKSPIHFFESVGLARDGQLGDGVIFLPFFISLRNPDGTNSKPIARALARFNEDGSAVCRGAMYEKATFSVGTYSTETVLSTTSAALSRINAEPGVGAALVFSCIVRRIACGSDRLQEARLVRDGLRPDIPFVFAYSGGEICPAEYDGKSSENRFHNFTFIACLL